MKFLLLFIILFFNGCSSKIEKSLSKKPNINLIEQNIDSLERKSNVLSVVENNEAYNYQGPLFWFGIIMLIVLFSAAIPLIFKNE